MIEFEFFDNLLDFIKELHELLKEDWNKFKIFVSENKTYVIWYIIAFITLQFTDVMSLGTSWNKYCKKNNIQIGGGNAGAFGIPAGTVSKAKAQLAAASAPYTKIPAPPPIGGLKLGTAAQAATAQAATAKLGTAQAATAKLATGQGSAFTPANPDSKRSQRKARGAAKKAAAAAAADSKAGAQAAPEKPLSAAEQKKADKRKSIDGHKDKMKASDAAKKAGQAGTSSVGGPGSEDSVKSVDKKIGFFSSLKNRVKGSAGTHGMAGPVLGNLDGIFGAVGGMFTFAAVILAIIGILSLPVLIFLIITYCVLKKLVGHFALY